MARALGLESDRPECKSQYFQMWTFLRHSKPRSLILKLEKS